jgi:glutamine synthetase
VLDEETLEKRGIHRLPTSLAEAVDAFEVDAALTTAFGADLVASIVAVRRGELEQLDGASEEDVAAATRWTH